MAKVHENSSAVQKLGNVLGNDRECQEILIIANDCMGFVNSMKSYEECTRWPRLLKMQVLSKG